MDLLILILRLGLVLLRIVLAPVLSVVGVIVERRHLESLAQREAELGPFMLDPTPGTALGLPTLEGELVSGGVVMGTGYLKRLMARLRTLFGGEVKGYQKVLDRGRREAQLRMIDQARRKGATAIVNVRFETTDIGGGEPAAEIFCYGTAIRQ